MKKLLTRYVFLIVCFFVSFSVIAGRVPPPGLTCCDLLYQDTNDLEAYEACEISENPNAYCEDELPIDNSIYIYISMVAAVALASFVMARRIKT